MPSVIRKESQLAIYRNEKPSPETEDYCNMGAFNRALAHKYHEDRANWFSTSERFEVHPEEEKRFEEYWCKINEGVPLTPIMLSNGIEIPDSRYGVRKKIVKNKDGSERGEFKNYAYFVPPSEGSHANKTGAGKPIIGLPEFLYTGDRGEIYIGFMGDTEVSHEWNQWLKANGLSENLSHEPVSIGDSREGEAELLNEAKALMQEFVGSVDRGVMRSKSTYAKFKEFLSRK